MITKGAIKNDTFPLRCVLSSAAGFVTGPRPISLPLLKMLLVMIIIMEFYSYQFSFSPAYRLSAFFQETQLGPLPLASECSGLTVKELQPLERSIARRTR